MVVCCPPTTRINGYPFDAALAGRPASVVLDDQVTDQDWRARKGQVNMMGLAEEQAKLVAPIRCAGECRITQPFDGCSFNVYYTSSLNLLYVESLCLNAHAVSWMSLYSRT